MVQKGKSYRYGKSMAPYRQPVSTSGANKASSFFQKMKSLFHQQRDPTNSDSKPVALVSGIRRPIRSHSPTTIPGGFFTSDTSAAVSSRPANSAYDNNSDVVMNSDSILNDDGSANETLTADTSNAKLADFFSKKGNVPLTEIEMEGVLSLMKKANRAESICKRSTANNTFDLGDSMDLGSTRLLKKSRTASVTNSPFKPPAFTPRYDDSLGSQSIANTSMRSTSSRRRVFDYSKLPTPYKTVVYKYSAADNKEENPKISNISPNSCPPGNNISSIETSKESTPSFKKLSNTASALVSLLDSDTSSREPAARFSNPYSSHVTQIREYKRNLNDAYTEPGTPSTGLKPNALLGNQDSKENPVSEILPKQREKSQPRSAVDKYKPVRSSSLRSNMVSAEESPEKDKNQDKSQIATKDRFTLNRAQDKSREAPVDGTTDKREAFQFFTDKQSPGDSASNQPHSLAGSVAKVDDNLRAANGGFKPQKKDNKDTSQTSDLGLQSNKATEGSHAKVEPGKPSDHNRTSMLPLSQKGHTAPRETFDFGNALPSNVNAETVDERKVEEFKSMYVF